MKIPKEISICFYALFSLSFFGFASGHNLTEQELRDYNISKEISSACPVYLAGNDEDNGPVWIMKMGQWDIRSFVERGLRDELDKWVGKFLLRMRDSGQKADETIGFSLIVDMDGFTLRQASHPKTVSTIIDWFKMFQKLIEHHDLKYAWIINSNFIFSSIWKLGIPFLGRLQENADIYGTDQKIWKPKLLRKIPQNQLPEKYGGLPDFKPVEVYD